MRTAFENLCRARDLLIDPDAPQLSIHEIAREACISPYHFIRRFEALFGVTPHQYRMRSRIDRAKLLLARGNHSVTDVCMEVGFASLGSFSGLFLRRVGETPSRYQRRARVLVQAPGALFPGCLSLMAQLPAPAFRNFQEVFPQRPPLESLHANQTYQPDGRGPG